MMIRQHGVDRVDQHGDADPSARRESATPRVFREEGDEMATSAGERKGVRAEAKGRASRGAMYRRVTNGVCLYVCGGGMQSRPIPHTLSKGGQRLGLVRRENAAAKAVFRSTRPSTGFGLLGRRSRRERPEYHGTVATSRGAPTVGYKIRHPLNRSNPNAASTPISRRAPPDRGREADSDRPPRDWRGW